MMNGLIVGGNAVDIVRAEDVDNWLRRRAEGLSSSGDRVHSVQCVVSMPGYWLAEEPELQFSLELDFRSLDQEMILLAASFSPLESTESAGASLRLCLDRPLLLSSVEIPKPWGREIWYTGVEDRGVCGFRADGGVIPLPWVLETLAPHLTAGQRELVLLKILDPLPEEVWGDLYFELHEEKQEVYVVTHVDPQAWPAGFGAIRFGFDPVRRDAYEGDGAFKQAFRDSVAAYEVVRRDIDQRLDLMRLEQGIAPNEALAPQVLIDWQRKLPPTLMARERELRMAMESFTQLKPLAVGDVVKVPCYTPHALQHGVRTVEFQTPVYERKIISFAQKVLTQGHWDTEAAVELMELRAAEEARFEVLQDSLDVVVERIVDFDDFEVQRWRLQPDCGYEMDLDAGYALIMAVDGQVDIDQFSLSAEQACLAPAGMRTVRVDNRQAESVTVLVAVPVARPRK